jgi:hypothetical protein
MIGTVGPVGLVCTGREVGGTGREVGATMGMGFFIFIMNLFILLALPNFVFLVFFVFRSTTLSTAVSAVVISAIVGRSNEKRKIIERRRDRLGIRYADFLPFIANR